MSILTKHTVREILKVGIITSLLGALMLMSVDLFSNLDFYTGSNFTASRIIVLTLMTFPNGFLMSMGPAFLFAVTYYFSMLHANNEIMCILNSGISYISLSVPVIIMAVAVGFVYFDINEYIAIPLLNEKQSRTNMAMYGQQEDANNSNIALSDMQTGYMIYASTYIDSTQTLYNVSYVDNPDNTLLRVNAQSAQWNEEKNFWELKDCAVYSSKDGEMHYEHLDVFSNEKINIEPELFRNLDSEISSMSLPLARNYLKKMKNVNAESYSEMATEFYKRVFNCFTPFVMMMIAVGINYRFKKNILFFSILSSLCIAVVYYVIQMVTVMLASQGIIAPWLGSLIPLLAIIPVSRLTFVLSEII